MKRSLAILAALAMMLALTACGSGNNGGGSSGKSGGESAARPSASALDAAFDSGSPTLTEKGKSVLNIAPEDVVLTDGVKAFADEYGSANRQELSAEELLKENELILISRSPAGNSGIVYAAAAVFSLYGGKLYAIYPSAARSVEGALPGRQQTEAEDGDITTLYRYWTSFCTNPLSFPAEQGFVYSPDGRYAAVPGNWARFATGFVDPIIIDLSTGEMIQTAAYASEGKAVRVYAAAFSADNRYYYYVMSAPLEEEGKRVLCRYDLEAGTTEICCGGNARLQYPDLAELRDGSWMMLNELRANSLLTASQTGGAWSLGVVPVPGEPHESFTRLLYSRNSGRAYIAEKNSTEGTGGFNGLAFHVFEPDNGFAGLDRYLCVTKGSHEIVPLTAEEYAAAKESAVREYQQKKGNKAITRTAFMPQFFPYELISCAYMSPDGNFLLMKTGVMKTKEE